MTNTEPRVWNIRDKDRPPAVLYVGSGRGRRGVWGNPFSMSRPVTAVDVAKVKERMPLVAELELAKVGETLTREQAIRLHRAYLLWALREKRLDLRELLHMDSSGNLRVRDLGCFCAPAPCHADTLLEIAQAYAYGVNEKDYTHETALDEAIYILTTR